MLLFLTNAKSCSPITEHVSLNNVSLHMISTIMPSFFKPFIKCSLKCLFIHVYIPLPLWRGCPPKFLHSLYHIDLVYNMVMIKLSYDIEVLSCWTKFQISVLLLCPFLALSVQASMKCRPCLPSQFLIIGAGFE